MAYEGAIAAGTAILGTGSSIYGAASAGKSNKKSRVAAKKLNDRNIQAQVEMWEKTNAYNTPLAQRQRLEAAGLNPMQMQAGGVTQNVSSSPNLPESQLPERDKSGEYLAAAGTGIQQQLMQYQDTKVRQKQLDVMDMEILQKAQNMAESNDRIHQRFFQNMGTVANTYKTQVQTEREKIGVEADQIGAHRSANQLDIEQQLHDTSIQAAQEKVRQIQLQNEGTILTNKNIPAAQRSALMEAQTRMNEARSRMTSQELQREAEKVKLFLRERGIETTDNVFARQILNTTVNVGEALENKPYKIKKR